MKSISSFADERAPQPRDAGFASAAGGGSCAPECSHSSAGIHDGRGCLRLSAEVELIGEERAALVGHRAELVELVAAWDAESGRRGAGQALAPLLREKVAEAGAAFRAAAAPVLFAEMERVARLALAPFHAHLWDGARLYAETAANEALRDFLNPERSVPVAQLADRAEILERAIEEALAGRIEWSFEGAEVAA